MPSAAAGSRATRAVRQLLDSLDEADIAAAATGDRPGLTVTITDPGVSKDLSDVSSNGCPAASRSSWTAICSWWSTRCGSAVPRRYRLAVRIGPNVTIRQAGGGILVDNQPINSPYEILALGPPHGMQDVFDRSPALQRLRLLETSYGVGVKVSAGDGLTLPAGSVRDVNFAMQIGPK